MQRTSDTQIYIRSLGWEDRLEKEMATHSNMIAWEIPWTEEPGRLQSMGSQRVDQQESGWSDLERTHRHHVTPLCSSGGNTYAGTLLDRLLSLFTKLFSFVCAVSLLLHRLFFSCGELLSNCGLCFLGTVNELLIAVASLVAEHGP